MKVKLLAAIMAVAMVGSSFAVAWDFDVDPSASWLGYINAFNVSDDAFAFGFPEPVHDTASANWAAGPALPLTMGPNTRIYDAEIANPAWVDQITFAPVKYIEFSYYQEVSGLVGDTASFDFSAIASDLPAGYEVRGFLKVLDGFASWATTQYEWVDISAANGSLNTLSLTVASPGAGTPIVQAGFSILGGIVSASDPIGATGLQVIPEPATIGLLGIAGLGMFVARRRLKI